jgi:hypothetical protein
MAMVAAAEAREGFIHESGITRANSFIKEQDVRAYA